MLHVTRDTLPSYTVTLFYQLEDEVARIIKDQRHLELRYNEIVQEQETLRQNHQSNTVAVSKKNGPTVAAAAAGNAKDSDAQRTGRSECVRECHAYLQAPQRNAHSSFTQATHSRSMRAAHKMDTRSTPSATFSRRSLGRRCTS